MQGNFVKYLQDVYQKRVLITTLARRELSLQYAQTMLGVLWTFIQPITNLAIYTYFFSIIIDIDTRGLPYPIIGITGLAIWNFFGYSFWNGGTSLVQNQDLIKKVPMPKMIIPLSKIVIGLVDFAVAVTLLFVLMVYYKIAITWKFIFLPVVVLLTIIINLCFSLWMNLLTVRFRDFHQAIPFLMTIGLWSTPVFYPAFLIPDKLLFLVKINPLAGIIQLLRWIILDIPMPGIEYAIVFFIYTILLFISIIYYSKIDGELAEKI